MVLRLQSCGQIAARRQMWQLDRDAPPFGPARLAQHRSR
jgi:hypothetical protein